MLAYKQWCSFEHVYNASVFIYYINTTINVFNNIDSCIYVVNRPAFKRLS